MNHWLLDLFEKQKKLDEFISTKKIHPTIITSVNDTANAFFVELGEFLNEVRAFKHWSVKEMDTEKAHEEFVDGLHFILSIGNQMWDMSNRESDVLRLQHNIHDVVTTDFNTFTIKEENHNRERFVSRSNESFTSSKFLLGTLDEYLSYFITFIRLGISVGLDVDKIVTEYNKKHEINYVRQTQPTAY